MIFLKSELTESSYVLLIVFSWDNRQEMENGSPLGFNSPIGFNS